MNKFDVIKRPIVTEKSSALKESKNAYVFEVDRAADKPMIRKSVEAIFGVKVARIQTIVVPGKPKRHGQHMGKTKSWKKAVVTLAEGKIEVFDGV